MLRRALNIFLGILAESSLAVYITLGAFLIAIIFFFLFYK